MATFFSQKWLPPALIFTVSLLGHGVWLHGLGYDSDDWPYLLVAHTQGWTGLWETASKFGRPIHNLLVGVFYSFLGLNPLGWHLISFLLKMSVVLLFWRGLMQLWPNRRLEATFAALLFSAYPGYQYEVIAFSGPWFNLPLAVCLLSLLAMTGANLVKRRRWLLNAGGLICVPVYFLIYEAVAGLELLRPLILWHLSKERIHLGNQSRLRWVIGQWSPYLFVFAVAVVCRFSVFAQLLQPITRDTISISWTVAQYLDNPISELTQLVARGATGVVEAAIVGWVPALQVLRIHTRSSGVAWFLLLLSGSLVFVCACYVYRDVQAGEASFGQDDRWAKATLVASFFAIAMGVIVPVLAFRLVEHTGAYSRFIVAPALGASLFVVALAKLLLRPRFQKVFLSFLVGSCVAANFSNTWAFKKDWDFQRSLYWQLSWRAPMIRSGTVLFFDVPPSPLEPRRDDVLAAAVNFIYGNAAYQPALSALNLRRPLNQQFLQGGSEYSRDVGSLSFRGHLRDSLVVYFDGRKILREPCLKVLNKDDPPQSSVGLLARGAAAYSNLDRIVYTAKSPIPPGGILGVEPPHRWCYYYQRIGLHRQQQDWAEVVRLTDEARAKGYSPEDLTEWLPSIEGYVQMGRWADAKFLLSVWFAAWEASAHSYGQVSLAFFWDACNMVERLRRAGKLTASDFQSFCPL